MPKVIIVLITVIGLIYGAAEVYKAGFNKGLQTGAQAVYTNIILPE